MRAINNFELQSIRKPKLVHLAEYKVIGKYQIFKSHYFPNLYAIFDQEFEIYRYLKFVGTNRLFIDESLKKFINEYYLTLSDEDKSVPTVHLPDDYLS